jgi:uncharacterized protein involved in exopolysaccharide biosynthesis
MAETKVSIPKIVARWVTVAFIVFTLTVLGGAYLTLQVLPKVYTATAEIQVKMSALEIPSAAAPSGTQQPLPQDFIIQIIASPDVLLPVINDLNLEQIWAKRLGKSSKLPPLEALAYLQKRLKLEGVRGTNIIKITISSELPEEAANIANAIADRYKTMRDVQEDQRNSRGTNSLQDQIEQQQKMVDEKKAAVDKLRDETAKNGLDVTAKDTGERALVDLDERQKDLLSAKVDHDARRVLLDQLKNLPDDEFVDTLSSLGRQDSNITPLRQEIYDAQTEMTKLRKGGAKDTDARVVELQEKIDRKQQMTKELIAGTRRAMQIDTEMAKARVALLQKEVDELKAKIQHSDNPQSKKLAAYRQAQRELEEQESLLDALTIRLKQVNMDRQRLESPVRIIARAQAPAYPSSPNKLLDLFLSVVAGLVLGPLVATVTEIGFWISRRSRKQTS